jgi:hypothetical protein
MDPLSQRAKLPRWKMGLVALGAETRGLVGGARGGGVSEAKS